MARPSTAPKYFGHVCKNCGGTLRYASNKVCVTCTQERNQKKYTPITPRDPKELVIHRRGRPARKIVAAIEGEARSLDARQRSEYLNSLILTPSQRAEPTLCYGDQHRAALPVGYRAASTQSNTDQKNRAAHTALAAAIAEILPDLPDLVHSRDVLAALPADARAPLLERQYTGLSMVGLAMRSLGFVRREIGSAQRGSARGVYVIRDPHGLYAGMKRREIEAVYVGRKVDKRRGVPLTAAQRARRYGTATGPDMAGTAPNAPTGTAGPMETH